MNFLARLVCFWLLAGAVASASQPVITVHFSPNGGCRDTVVTQINTATNRILIQAYNFTSPAIGDALAAAAKRGVTVVEIQDNIAAHQKTFQGPKLKAAGGKVFIDAKHKIAHNKIMILDGATLITGSFNFSENAEQFNAENLLVIKGAPDLVSAYTVNWSNHLAHATPLK